MLQSFIDRCGCNRIYDALLQQHLRSRWVLSPVCGQIKPKSSDRSRHYPASSEPQPYVISRPLYARHPKPARDSTAAWATPMSAYRASSVNKCEWPSRSNLRLHICGEKTKVLCENGYSNPCVHVLSCSPQPTSHVIDSYISHLTVKSLLKWIFVWPMPTATVFVAVRWGCV